MDSLRSKRIEIDGIEYEATIYMGDGKLYDANREPGMPIRQGSFLLRPVVEIVEISHLEDNEN